MAPPSQELEPPENPGQFKGSHDASHDGVRQHLQLFVVTHNYGRRVKILRGLTPCESICQSWTNESGSFRLNPSYHMPELNI
jgi:hypothetical protein